MSITTIPKLIKNSAEKWPEIAAQYSKDESGTFCPTSFAELMDRIYNVSAGLLSLGIKRADCVGLIADNRKEWLQSSMGIMAIGAADVPRGCDATLHELSYILSFTECVNVIAENTSQAEKVLSQKEHLPVLKRIISFDPISDECKAVAKKAKVEILLFDELIAKGKEWREKNPQKVEEELEKGTGEELACIIFTSGTTGVPKGVMLSHSNFLAQLVELPERIYLNPGEKALSVLPVWHSFERSCEYVVLLQGSAVCYSKPIGSIMLPDFQALNPQIIPAVPRVFEAVYEGVNRSMRKTGGIVLALYQFFTAVAICHARAERTLFNKTARFKKQNDILRRIALVFPWVFLYPLKALGSVIIFKKIRAKLGNDFRGGVSGGGALPPAVDEFFWAIGINLVEGYGLTETSPVVSVRPFYDPVFGTIGKPLRGVEARIIGENGKVLGVGQKGVVEIRGGIVMQGYYKRPDLTESVINKDGWLNTGDLGRMTIDGELSLCGRIKDTIVLRGGENIEPLPIEMKLKESAYIAQCVVLGQDKRHLGALIVPEADEITTYAKENNIAYNSYAELIKDKAILSLFKEEINTLISNKNGFRLFERINRFVLLEKPFEVGFALSAKQEIMRHKISELYAIEENYLFR